MSMEAKQAAESIKKAYEEWNASIVLMDKRDLRSIGKKQRIHPDYFQAICSELHALGCSIITFSHEKDLYAIVSVDYVQDLKNKQTQKIYQ